MRQAIFAGLVALLLIGGFHFATTSGEAATGSVQAAVETMVHASEARASYNEPHATRVVAGAEASRAMPRRPTGVTPGALK